jgi:hypothetical protein
MPFLSAPFLNILVFRYYFRPPKSFERCGANSRPCDAFFLFANDTYNLTGLLYELHVKAISGARRLFQWPARRQRLSSYSLFGGSLFLMLTSFAIE